MHDMIGSAGMLGGWVDVWTTHMLWLLAPLIVSVGAGALAKLLIIEHRQVVRDAAPRSVAPPPRRHDKGTVYSPISRGTGRSHGSVGRAE